MSDVTPTDRRRLRLYRSANGFVYAATSFDDVCARAADSDAYGGWRRLRDDETVTLRTVGGGTVEIPVAKVRELPSLEWGLVYDPAPAIVADELSDPGGFAAIFAGLTPEDDPPAPPRAPRRVLTVETRTRLLHELDLATATLASVKASAEADADGPALLNGAEALALNASKILAVCAKLVAFEIAEAVSRG